MSSPVLELRSLAITYHSGGVAVPAVRGVDLVLEAGDTLGLAGESGCGKSTVAAAVLRLLPSGTTVDGQILLGGQDVMSLSPGALRAVRWTEAAIIFQGALHSLNPVQRVGRQIEEAIELHSDDSPGARRRRVGELFEQVGLPPTRVDAYPHQLSGGQRQRVLIALALACRPHLLIADEPTTALDVMVQAQVLALLDDLQQTHGLTVLMITHDLSVLRTSCRRLAVMYAGRIVEHGPSEEVFAAPSHPYTRALAGAFPTIGDPASRLAPRGLGGDPPDPAVPIVGCAFAPRCPVAIASCSNDEPALVDSGPGRAAACVHVGGQRDG